MAYFSMEVGLNSAMPTYAGGLGILAGDTLRAAADLGVPMVGVTLLHRKGYFRQQIDRSGNQRESPADWSPEEFLEPLADRVSLTLEGRKVQMRVWRHLLRGITGHTMLVLFLDTQLPENSPEDQTLTDHLYGGDSNYRLRQEAVLGLGGVAMLRALGFDNMQAYHMNEGYSALLALALLKEQVGGRGLRSATQADVEAVRRQCVFTTHTPVPAGHDQFPMAMVRQVLDEELCLAIERHECCQGDTLNMTYLALYFSRYINGVSMRHEEVSQNMYPNYPINAVTNGVHAATWTAPPFAHLYDRHVTEWRQDNQYLRYAVSIPLEELLQAHRQAKEELVEEVVRRTGVSLEPTTMTLGFARRATAYKRTDLLFSDLERLRRIAREVGPFQVVYGGKAHPQDWEGKELIRRIFQAGESLKDQIRVIYLEEYDMALARLFCAGVDLWLNTPQKPQEASGTSGMKAALNGVPSFSVLDGWWVEGHEEGVTGWCIGEGWEKDSDPVRESASLYDKLENQILPMFYGRPLEYARVMRSAIALNGSFFNAQRMISQYMINAYHPAHSHLDRHRPLSPWKVGGPWKKSTWAS
ncbi:MAG TPA: alpha-glucan family phosphorylase [Dehalococcoidia bacterium]|nr:alpha-glucan family phosphorylase [Dehalococcoidia bacterium]